jgi:hypothetical protein
MAGQLGLAATTEKSPEAAPKASEADNRLRLLLLPSGSADPRSAIPGHEVDEHFMPLRSLVSTDAGAQINRAMKPVIDLQQQLAKMAASAARTARPPTTTRLPHCG